MSKKRSSAHTRAQKAGRERDGNICQICGSSDHAEGHHILDYAFSGSADKDNIITLCHDHHQKVHKGLIDIFKF